MIMIDWIVTHVPTVCGLVLAFLLGMIMAMYLFAEPVEEVKTRHIK
ncbi:hypothetical protein [Schleiferilactobacillus harbinensis]|uniref:Uncharacterized protein n=1 Tax=Schleiferilactobacillus harbinensis TaxID=304207 RepID=A0ABU7SZR9_9LACO